MRAHYSTGTRDATFPRCWCWTSYRGKSRHDLAYYVSKSDFSKDALVLSELLAHPRVTREAAHQALRAYSDVRLPVAMAIYNASRRSGQLMGDSIMSPEAISEEFAKVGRSAWARGSPEDDAKRALDLLEEAL